MRPILLPLMMILLSAASALQMQGRRAFLASASISAMSSIIPAVANAEAAPKHILVLGGTGLVGSQVCKELENLGIAHTATGRSVLDVTSEGADQIYLDLVKKTGASAVISCIGSFNTPLDYKINSASGHLAEISPDSVTKFSYISVSPAVQDAVKGLPILPDYMKGKTESNSLIQRRFPGRSTLVKPSFIYGGSSFSVNPPRVTSQYGSFIESILGSGLVRGVAGVTPGLISVALTPPISVVDVAKAAVNSILTEGAPATLDSYDDIRKLASR